MHSTDSLSTSLPCIGMTAGLVSYRLCDREYDCDHCPFDAALRGITVEAEGANPSARGWGSRRPEATLEAAATEAAEASRGDSGARAARRRPGSGEFPGDRRFGAGHTWARGVDDGPPGRVRVGLDGFAAALLEVPRAVRCVPAGSRLARGDGACELDLAGGVLTLGAPLAGELVAANRRCQDDPALLLAEPYGEGWLLELAAAAPAATDNGDGLCTAEEARRRSGHDLRRFRRRVAFDLLAADDGVGPTLPDGGEPVVDLRGLLGARRYLELLRELVH